MSLVFVLSLAQYVVNDRPWTSGFRMVALLAMIAAQLIGDVDAEEFEAKAAGGMRERRAWAGARSQIQGSLGTDSITKDKGNSMFDSVRDRNSNSNSSLGRGMTERKARAAATADSLWE